MVQLKSRPCRRREGSVLVAALVVVLVVGALAAGMFQMTSAVTRRQNQAVDLKEAFYLAEAGLAEAVAGVAVGKSGNVGSEAEPAVFGSGLFWVEAEELGAELVRLECTAMQGGASVTLAHVVRRGKESVGLLGVFSDEALLALPGTLIDAFDSSAGPYAPDSGLRGRVGSNESITLEGTAELPTVVQADVAPGPTGTLTLEGDVRLSGTTDPALAVTELPAITPPSFELQPGTTHVSGVPLVVNPGGLALEFLHVGAESEVILEGPLQLVVGELTLAPGGELSFETTGGAVEVTVLDDLQLASGSTVSTSGSDPAAVTLQLAGETAAPVELAASAAFHGVFYAPLAEVHVAQTFEVFGALVGKKLVFTGPGRVHFDTYLIELGERAAKPEHVSWRIVELSSELVEGSSDPFQILGLDPGLLPAPRDAHADQVLVIGYVDHDGAFQTYEGWESLFDWPSVARVVEATRDDNVVVRPSRGDLFNGDTAEPAGVPALDLIGDASLNSSALRNALEPLYPLTASELAACINRTPAMNSSDLRSVLVDNSPLTPAVLMESVQQPPLDSSSLRDVLVENSPLPTPVVDAATNRVPAMNPSDLTTVLGAQ